MNTKYQFIFFAINGILGLIVDLLILFLASMYFNFYVSRFISFFSAVIVTWILNRNLTFKQKSHLNIEPSDRYIELFHEFKRYFLAVLMGGVINLSLYSCYIYFNFDSLDKYVATILGSFSGLVSNFIFVKYIVFKK